MTKITLESSFNIVRHSQDKNGIKHNKDAQQEALIRLSQTAEQADSRNLDRSAKRFHPSDSLLVAINAALVTRVPLLLTGEPGTGKTQVAWYLKHYFGIPLFEYQVRSNSEANDLRYDFDAVAYLRNAYLAAQVGQQDNDRSNDPRLEPKYLKPGVLWQAYEHDGECIILIDEIDKASRDFPNDLLQELDQHRFAHPFVQGEFIECKGAPPITLITSNGERRLPDAFLRRCIVHHIELTTELLNNIMMAWQTHFPDLDKEISYLALSRFIELRENDQLTKKPGAAELLLWLSVLSAQNTQAEQLKGKVLKDLPALNCLLKDHEDYSYLDA